MATEIIMPVFGFTQEESEIVKWLANEGDQVEQGDPVAEVTTDKVNMEVEAPKSGTFGGLQYKAGSVVPVTSVIAFILEEGEKAPKVSPKQAHKKEKAAPVSSPPKAAPPRATGNGSKQAPRSSEASPYPSLTPLARRIASDRGLDPGSIAGTGPGGVITRRDVEASVIQVSSSQISGGKVRATPAARRLAQERGLSLNTVIGTGPRGRIQVVDLDAPQTSAKVSVQLPQIDDPDLKTIPFSSMRRTIASRLQQSAQQAPHIYFQKDIVLDYIFQQLEIINIGRSKKKKISITAVLVKLMAKTLENHPLLNSHLGEEVVLQYSKVNLGLAVALDEGLIVPVIHDVNSKDLEAVSAEVKELAARSRAGKLKPDEMQGATISISNLGMFQIDRFTAIINPPEVAILAVGGSREVFLPDEKGKPVLKNIVTFTLSVDHRAIDGAVAAAFMRDLKSKCENSDNLDAVIKG